MGSFDIDQFRAKWPDFNRISRGEIQSFFRVCSDPHSPNHEFALGLLLNPEETELIGYYLWLASFLSISRIRVSEIPEELLEVFYELVAFAGKFPQDPSARKLFKQALIKISAKLLGRLSEKRFPLRPFIESIGASRLFPGSAPPMPTLRKRWRLLRNQLLAGSPEELPDRSIEITLEDLKFLIPAGKRPGRVNSAWRAHGIPHLSRGKSHATCAGNTFKQLYWTATGNRGPAFWDKLIAVQSEELAAIRNLAREVSSRTRRVVLSWHNASLAAAGGWAFEELAAQFPSPELYEVFAHEVFESAAKIRKSLDLEAVSNLCDLRAKRFFSPKATHAIEQIRMLSIFESYGNFPSKREGAADYGSGNISIHAGDNGVPHSRSSRQETVIQAAALIGTDAINVITARQSNSEWLGALSPHQQVSLQQVLAWHSSQKAHWTDGLIQFLALASAGQKMLDSGKISALVLPWIDKFFISSRRKADKGYLERLFRLIAGVIPDPLILFWEDTAHRQLPSFCLALDDLAKQGLPFRGIGIFDSIGSSTRLDAVDIICLEYPDRSLFALRPLNDNHCTDAYRRIFKDSDFSLFKSYDSSWKDNLVFIYCGTQVFPLLSVQTEPEYISSWVSDRHGKYPFGAWFRQRLRTGVLDKRHTISDPLSLAHASWANLL